MEKIKSRVYLSIDLKSFYASVECASRGLDPLDVNLVVADSSRTEKTICLAVSPSLKSLGIPGRPRLFEVVEKVNAANEERRAEIGGKSFNGSSYYKSVLDGDPFKSIDYIVAPPRMAEYMAVSTRIYDIYLKYVAPEDMHVYSVDEVFIDVTDYLKIYNKTARELAMTMIKDVLNKTGITATAGIGTNLYLAKLAMDIVAKKMPADADGVRIAELDERSFRENLWSHLPLTDFWRIGKGLEKRLNKLGLYTFGDIARCSIAPLTERLNEEVLYKEFGVNAELLIDHAWGKENTLISDIKSYVPQSESLTEGQVLERGYPFEQARTVVKEMADALTLSIVKKGLVTNLITLDVGYDIENLSGEKEGDFEGETAVDRYGRRVPKGVHGSYNFGGFTASSQKIVRAASELFSSIADEKLTVRRLNISANIFSKERVENGIASYTQTSLFDEGENVDLVEEKDGKISLSVIKIQGKYGKNAILKANSFTDGATRRKRNGQIGGHKA